MSVFNDLLHIDHYIEIIAGVKEALRHKEAHVVVRLPNSEHLIVDLKVTKDAPAHAAAPAAHKETKT